jgi:hypothetical protein
MKVRLGHGANCSSIGAVVDTLFASAVVSTMIFAAVAAAMTREPITIIGKNKPIPPPEKKPKPTDDVAEKKT